MVLAEHGADFGLQLAGRKLARCGGGVVRQLIGIEQKVVFDRALRIRAGIWKNKGFHDGLKCCVVSVAIIAI